MFEPTFLYIKQHSVTRKLYFGKTKYNPAKYLGSGLHWKNHIKKHGKEHVVTLWYCLFLDQESCTEFALNFSTQHCIVESEEWLNLKPENGLDGGCITGLIPWNKGKCNIHQHSEETKLKMSNSHKNTIHTAEWNMKVKLALTGKKKTQTHVNNNSLAQRQYVTCPHCGKTGGKSAMHRWHFDNCVTQDKLQ